ncbi:MAG: polysaccharide pyruvyl transferase family protein [Anaerolineaceae bacterium]|nr:polysaccharide pyruvyl transferase family protein [Anaerolineaceae bacterium]
MKRIAIAGEIYSSNVGDQAIHDCLAYLLKKADSATEILHLDTSGRLGQAIISGKMRPQQRLALLQSSSRLQPLFPALNFAYSLIKKRRRLAAWEPALRSADLLVIGGGQLLMDDALSFPLKLSGLTQSAKKLGIPYAITACGVGKSWSAAGRSLFRSVLEGAGSITLRDPLSQERLKQFLAELSSRVTFDPAIWAAAAYPADRSEPKSDTIGLGVINSSEVNVHLEPAQRKTDEAWLEIWLELIHTLRQSNQPIELFTTGSLADQKFALKLLAAIERRGGKRVTLLPRPINPEGLISALQKFSLVIAARLHAAVLANAFGISTIGLAWDDKVKAYYGLTHRSDLCFELIHLQTRDVARACAELSGQPFPAAEIEEYKACSFEDARILLKGA